MVDAGERRHGEGYCTYPPPICSGEEEHLRTISVPVYLTVISGVRGVTPPHIRVTEELLKILMPRGA